MSKTAITLTALQLLINETINNNFKQNHWVTAEISELRENYSGHNYLELIDRDESSEQISAKIKAIIWSKKSRFILPYFKSTTGIDLTEGLSILVQGKIEYHPVYGLSFIINDIDPNYTIGDIERKRNLIIARLTDEGVIDMNKEIVLALAPTSIAIISSKDAAGYGDFINQLSNNIEAYSYKFELFNTVMQGLDTSRSVLNSLDQIAENLSNYDLVVIVRGGGSSTDLSWFDDYDIAYMISQFPLPIISGIGHDRDQSVADIVAHTSCKTPTAVAEFILSLSRNAEQYLLDAVEGIYSLSESIITEIKNKLQMLNSQLESESKIIVQNENQNLKLISELIFSQAGHLINLNSKNLAVKSNILKTSCASSIKDKYILIDNMTKSLKYLSPDYILKKGYSLTIKEGKVLKSSNNTKIGDKISTILGSGKIDSKVHKIKIIEK